MIEAKQVLLKGLKAEIPAAAAAADAHQNGDGTGVASPSSGLSHTLRCAGQLLLPPLLVLQLAQQLW